MALKITDENGIFIIEGSINYATYKLFTNQLNSLMNNNKNVVINIDKVNHLDNKGLSILRKFYLHALRDNKKISIIGLGNKVMNLDLRKTHNNGSIQTIDLLSRNCPSNFNHKV